MAVKKIGILTSGGDCPGLNPTIRALVKSAVKNYGMTCIGILDGFRGLVENRTIALDDQSVSGILTEGGTILGTARDKPHKYPVDGERKDMTAQCVSNFRAMGLDLLVCLGGGGTQKNALVLSKAGIPVLTLPKTIDNDVAGTATSFGFDTAMGVATDAIDRLHSTASSHQRIILVEIMGHSAGWLALGAGIAGGADVILIPEIPYDRERIAQVLLDRRQRGKKFSIVAMAEGAISKEDAANPEAAAARTARTMATLKDLNLPLLVEPQVNRLARELSEMTGLETRTTVLGHVQRGGIPSATDRLLCTRLGTTAARLIAEGQSGIMVAVKGGECVPVPLSEVAGIKKVVPVDHSWIQAARLCGISFGD